MTTIQLQHVTKHYSDILALEDVSFTLESGKVLALIGPSGAGKSTLLRVIAGLEAMDSGELLFDKASVRKEPPSKRNLAMITQETTLFPRVKVKDNITYGLHKLGYTNQQMQERLEGVASLLHIEDLLERYPHALSGGERQRVGIARAIIREPKVLLLDEPFANLDERLKADLQKEVKLLQKSTHMTMILVSHDQEEARYFGDVIGILNKGKLMAFGTAEELYAHPHNVFTASFFGTPKMNFVDGKVVIRKGKMTLQLWDSNINLERGCPEQEVLIGFHPEDIVLHPVGEYSGIVDHVDRFGQSYLYTLQMDNDLITMVSNTKHSVGEMVEFDLPLEALTIFNAKGERMEIA